MLDENETNKNETTAVTDQPELDPEAASPPAHDSTSSDSGRARRYVLQHQSRYREIVRLSLPYMMLVGLTVYFSARADIFLSNDNFLNLIRQGSVLLIVSVGSTFVILQGGIDLSVGAIATLTSIVSAFVVADWGLGLTAFPIAALLGAGVGMVTGVLVAYIRVPSFLVTLGMLSVVTGVGNFTTQGSNKRLDHAMFSGTVRGTTVAGLPNLLWWALGIFILALCMERVTKLGRYTYSIGGGELVSKMAGVPVARYKLYAFTASGFCAGLAGGLLAARISAGGPGLGDPLMLEAITAITIGGTALTGGVGGVGRTLLGVMIVTTLRNGLILTQVGAFTQQIVTGAVLIIAVALSLDRRRLRVVK